MESDDDHTEINSVLGDLWMNAEQFCDDEAWETLCLLMDEFAICGFIFAVLKADSHNIYMRSVLYNSLNDFGIALRKLEVQLGRAARKGGRRVKKAKKFSLLVMKFQDCMAHFRPNIGRGLDEAIHLTCRIQWTRFNEWRKLLNPHLIDVSINFLYQKQECLSSNVKSCLEAIPEVILSLNLFLVEIIPTPIDGNFECNSLLNFVGASLIQAVHSIYSWSMVNFSDQNLVEQEKMANDLLKRLMPITPVTIDVFVNVLKASIKFKLWETKDAASHFVHLLIPSEEEGKGSSLVGVETIRKALVGLVSYLIYAPEIPVGTSKSMKKMLLIHIGHVVCRFGSLRPLLYAKNEIVIKETGLALFKLLDKMEFLNLELLFLDLEYLKVYLQKPLSLGLKRLIDQESVSRQRKQESLLRIDIQDLIDSLHEGLELLRSYPCQFSQVNNVRKMKRLWRHIEDLTRMAAFVLSTFDDGSITRTAVDEICELQLKIMLLKIEVILMELLEGQSSLCVATREQVERFYEGIVFIRNFLMSPLDMDGKLILPRVEALAFALDSHLFDGQGDLSLTHLQDFLPYLQERIVLVKVKITESYQHIRSVSQYKFPKKSGFKFIDFILESIREQLGREFCTNDYAEHYIQVVYDEMEEIMKCFPRAVAEQHDEESDLNNLGEAIKNAALQAEYLIDSFAVRNGAVWYHVLWISDLIEELKVIKNQVFEISKNIPHISINNVEQPSTDVIRNPGVSNFGDIMIDLRDQATLIIDKLIAGSSHQDVVSIVGMPGLGKTTLAQKVYNDPSVTHYFHVRAWTCVSQKYQRRKLLLDLLSNLIELTDDIHELIDDDLDFKLYQCLKQRKYLIVLDDFWSIEPWNDLRVSLPDDKNGSRILITSRLPDVASKTKPGSIPHQLRLLPEDESWELFQRKLFQFQDCPDELVEVGKRIVGSCKGLPLAVIAVSGLLQRTDKPKDWWNQVAESLSSHIIVDSAEIRCMEILELSYKHLSNHLKPCFLYVGTFLADQEIPVWKLKCLWIAEGLINKTDTKSLEDVAEECLKELIGRSLIMVSKRSSSGGLKTCRVHDLLHAMCLVKCKEHNFLQPVYGYDQHFSSSFEDLDYGVYSNHSHPSCSIAYDTYRLCIYSMRNHFVMLRPSGKQVRSLLFFASTDTYPRCPYDISFILLNFKLLRVLDLECINMGSSFPKDIEFLVHLRFLSICGDVDLIPASIYKLWNLETLLVKGWKGQVLLPMEIWMMVKLRHINVSNYATLKWPDNLHYHFPQLNLVSVSTLYLYGGDTERILRMLHKLRKLRCIFAESQNGVNDLNEYPDLRFLVELESLKVYFSGRIARPRKFMFPPNLKKLTLSKFCLPWDHISEVGKLPNLEVLKLLSRSFQGKIWNMREGEFLKLKFLKLDTLNLALWNASSDHLPMLGKLVVQNCRQLEEIPSDFAEINTLDMIEVNFCGPSVEESVKRLKAEKNDFGHEEFEVFIDGSVWKLD